MIKETNCDCVFCKHNHDVDFPEELLNEMLSGKVALFAGAGISTESRNVLNVTFYETILSQVEKHSEELNFPSVMEHFCDQPNGRFKLLSKIRSRFDTIDSFPELKKSSTRFHKELGTLFPIKNIITTNWDTYFEQYCKATPFVVDSDLVFWEVAKRRVLKIHGSIDNLASIVATNQDYEECGDRLKTGLIGGLLKTILATQTVVFVGYSLSDSDFIEVYSFVKEQMQQLHKQAYVVTPFKKEAEELEKQGLIPIVTDGAYFLSQVKEHAVSKEVLISDSIFDDADVLLSELLSEHMDLYDKISLTEYPQVIHAASYQDGLQHALERAIEMRYSGDYSHKCRLSSVATTYESMKSKYLKKKSYNDAAYIEGYLNGIIFLLLDEDERLEITVPKYYAFGCKYDLFTFDEFHEFIHENPDAHKAALKGARKIIESVSNPEEIVFHHPPWL